MPYQQYFAIFPSSCCSGHLQTHDYTKLPPLSLQLYEMIMKDDAVKQLEIEVKYACFVCAAQVQDITSLFFFQNY